MFEQSVFPEDRSQRPRTFLLVTVAELLVLAATIVLPLFWIAGPSIPKLPALLRYRPRSIPIEVVPVERLERATPKRSPFPFVYTPNPPMATRPAENRDLSAEPAPDIGAGDALGTAGVPWGVDRAVPDAKVTPPPPAPQKPPAVKKETEPLRVSQGVQEAKLIHKVMPVYPRLAVQTHQFGTVRLVAVIGKDGHMRDIQVVSGPLFLVRAAVEAVKQWVYKPTLLNGDAVEVIAPITVNFTLSQ